jgi:hypothetical protein
VRGGVTELGSHPARDHAHCRRLADATTDERTQSILRKMADEGEQDMRRLEAELDKDWGTP